MKRSLIINADDCNLTRGVSRAILECHDEGLVTSTTFMINQPIESKLIRSLKKRKKLGIGVHLNVTLGQPVSASKSLKSLLTLEGRFHKGILGSRKRLTPAQSKSVLREYEAQLQKFKKVFGKKPTHLDTHHQVHDRADFLNLLLRFAKKYRLPIRRSKLFAKHSFKQNGVYSTHALLGDLRVNGYWRRQELERGLRSMPDGISEVMAHPGYVDGDLRKISSFTTGRHHEWRLFRSENLKQWMKSHEIQLTHYGICYNK